MQEPEQNDQMNANEDGNDPTSPTEEMPADDDGNDSVSPPRDTSQAPDDAPVLEEDQRRDETLPQEQDDQNPSMTIIEPETGSAAPEPADAVTSAIVPTTTQDDSPMPANESVLTEAQMEDSPAIADDDEVEIDAIEVLNQIADETAAAEEGIAEDGDVVIDAVEADDQAASETDAAVDKDNSPQKVMPSSEHAENSKGVPCVAINVPNVDVEHGAVEENKQQKTEEFIDDSIVEEEDEEEVCGIPRRTCFAITVVVLVITAIALAIGVGVSSGNKKDSAARRAPTMPPSRLVSLEPTPELSAEPTSGPYMQDLAAIVFPPGKEFQGLDELDPEYMALQWMTDSDVRGVPLKASSTELLERFALVTLYFATSGDELWSDNFLWLTESSHCNWSMIECSGDGSVRGLYMGANNLTGTLPVEMFWNLKNIEDVNLGSNSLSGSLPTEIGLWTQASFVNFEANAFDNTIPTTIGKMTSLTNFGAALNQFSGNLPSEIGMLSQLTSLQLWENSLSGSLPTEVTMLLEMKGLGLANNMFQGSILTEFGLMTKLFDLQLFGNGFGGSIPSELGLLTGLGDLGLSNNDLTGALPTELGSLTALSVLVLSNNNLSSTIPAQFGNMRDLEYLNVEENVQISGAIPKELSNAPLLSYFDATGCGISGSLPSEIGLFTSLTFLDVSKTPLDGVLPTELGNLNQLQTLSVWGTKISGTVPSELSRLSNVSRIFFDDTDLTGGLEDLFCDLAGTLGFTFWSDCGGFEPELLCACCTHCCDPNGSDCEEVVN